MRLRIAALAATAIFGLGLHANAAITVTPSTSASALVNNILGSGVTVVGTPTLSSSSTSAGFFTGGTPSIGIQSGILLTSGDVAAAADYNGSDSFTGTANGSGDSDLNTLATLPTRDSTILEFDFEFTGGAGGSLFFNYVFASEEYNEYSNSQYNDVFGFFLDGANIALLPSSTTPVGINTVNGGNPLGVNPQNPQYYVNNDPSDGGPFQSQIGYDGFTVVLRAVAENLAPGVHHIKLAISDTSDSALDSGVFIQGGTFSDTPTDPGVVPEPATIVTWSLLAGLGLVARFRKSAKK